MAPLSILAPSLRGSTSHLEALLSRRPRLVRPQQLILRAQISPDNAAARDAGNPLFQPLQLGPYQLEHRVVLAPLTRCRALGNVPQPNMAVYYTQRTTEGGLLISEATSVSERGYGYVCVPGLHRQDQVEGWKPVVEAVHSKGGIFYAQLWHAGRASCHYQLGGELPVSASALPITDGNQVINPKTFQPEDFPTPRALETSEVPGVIAEFAAAAENAAAAGFDGVELHGASGYLINQFLCDESNQRSDAYGGSVENRCRFVLELLEAVTAAMGEEKVGLRLAPFGGYLIGPGSDVYGQYTHLLKELNAKFPKLSYVHMVGPRMDYQGPDASDSLLPFREAYKGLFIAASGYDCNTGMQAVADGAADAIAYGRLFISNPDLPRRFALDSPLNKYDRSTFYAQGDEGYIDYPALP